MKIEISTEDLVTLMLLFKREISEQTYEDLLQEIESHVLHFQEDFESLEITEW